MEVVIHPRVCKYCHKCEARQNVEVCICDNVRGIAAPKGTDAAEYIYDSGEQDRIIGHLKELVNDPYNSRSGVDIKRLQGRKHDMYRLRVGPHRFEYFVEEGKIWIDEGFTRGKGYR